MKKYFMFGITVCLLAGMAVFTSCDKDDDKKDDNNGENTPALKANQICYGDKVLDFTDVEIQKEIRQDGSVRYYVFGEIENEPAFQLQADVESNQVGVTVDVSKVDGKADFYFHINFETQADGMLADLQLDARHDDISGFFATMEEQQQYQGESMFSTGNITFTVTNETAASYILEGTLKNGKRMAFNVSVDEMEIYDFRVR